MEKYPLLDRLESPEDLRKLPEEDLPALCEELRGYLIEVVSGTGGHFSSSLGVVELTVALHYVLDTPRDMLVWDVGHQAYIHKILTGRREALKAIRQKDGISGFLKRSESPYDVYGAGHASTALSAAYGMAVARDLSGKRYRVAAVFGDGALTGGLCYEALNNAGGANKRPFLAILNDNEMSISPNVGAIHRYLNNFVQTKLYEGFRKRVKEGLERIPPRYGKPMTHLARRLEEAAKTVLTPGALFEAMGFDYFGPMDGHDVLELVRMLRHLKDKDHPVLLHVITLKGKGYAPAEASPEGYHGVKPFCPEDGIQPSPPGKPSFQEVFGRSLVQLAKADPRVVGITAAMPTGTGIVPFAEAFPDRFFDVGIAEEHGVVFAAGLATQGFRPVCAIYSTFLQRAYDPIVHDVCIQHLPVIFCLDRAGLAGEDGPTHHGTFDVAYLRHLPGMVVASPRNGNELRDLMATALSHDGGPFAIRYPKASAGPFDPEGDATPVQIGSWEVARRGDDVLLLAVGPMVDESLAAAETLASEGIEAEVVNCRFVKPLDSAYLERRAPSFPVILTVEEGSLAGGFGSAVQEWAEESGLSLPIRRLGIPDRFIPHGPRPVLLSEMGLDARGIDLAASEAFRARKARSQQPRRVLST